jgi:uncharacterized protein (UPF0548 family)
VAWASFHFLQSHLPSAQCGGRMVRWLKEHRRIATRFEKLASSFLAMVKLSFMRRYFRMLERFSYRT